MWADSTVHHWSSFAGRGVQATLTKRDNSVTYLMDNPQHQFDLGTDSILI